MSADEVLTQVFTSMHGNRYLTLGVQYVTWGDLGESVVAYSMKMRFERVAFAGVGGIAFNYRAVEL